MQPAADMPSPEDDVVLIDGSSFVFRSYFQSLNQDRKYNHRSDGLPTGAVRLFCTKLLQWTRDGAAGIRPTHLGVILDKSEESFRKKLYPPYKANRPEPPAELVPQFPLMREAIRAFGLEPIEQEVYEADDLIATYASQAQALGARVLIISADKDLMQLVGERITFYDSESGIKGRPGYRPERLLDEAGVRERWEGIAPAQITDVQALSGDSSDNIPGAPGIGIKTAAQLITEYGDLETLLARAHEIRQPKRRDTLTDPAVIDSIRISLKLATLVRDVPLTVPLEALRWNTPDPKPLLEFLKEMEFSTLTRRVAEMYDMEVSDTPPPRRKASPALTPSAATDQTGDENTPQALAAQRRQEARAQSMEYARYETIGHPDQLKDWMERARAQGYLAFDTETDSLDAMQASLVGLSLALAPNVACYIPLGHSAGEDLFGDGRRAGQMAQQEALALVKPVLEDPAILKIGHNIKYDMQVLESCGIRVQGIDDTMLMSCVLDSGRHGHGMDELSERHLGHQPISYDAVTGTGKNRISFARVGLEQATHYAAEDADVTLRLWRIARPRLVAERLLTVYETLERPLVPVIVAMERAGITIDRQRLAQLSGEFAIAMQGLEKQIHALAGEDFNPASPKQLGDILFGRMQLPGGTKTRTGAWSTAAGVLEDLAEQGHELPRKILDWRQLAKLRSTYTEALPGFVHPYTQRVHTSFALAATTTGRLSSSEPNVQNIPIRTPEGRRIRSAFIASPGHQLVSADYSQIELRLLAHVADIPQLRRAFAEKLDIHAMTASEMFGVPLAEMTPEIRRRAKAINFGIIYGISAFGLASQLGIGRQEAGAYIKTYFERFPGIRDYMESMKAFCRQHGYVETIFGRRCHYPGITSSNAAERAFAERQAINAPLQGAAADIIRRAMIRMPQALHQAGSSARMLLQVHDELVFEVRTQDAETAIPLICQVMRQAPLPAVALKVPLEVEARAALNWDEAH